MKGVGRVKGVGSFLCCDSFLAIDRIVSTSCGSHAGIAAQVLSDALFLDLDSNHEGASIGVSSDEERMSVRSGCFACCLDSLEAINVDCGRKRKKKEATNTNSCETYYRSNNFIVVIDTSRLLQASVLTLSLKAFVLCLIEEALHDRFFELNWIVDLEGAVANPRDDVIEAVKGAFFQHHVKLPRECSLSAASSLGQHFSHLGIHIVWF